MFILVDVSRFYGWTIHGTRPRVECTLFHIAALALARARTPRTVDTDKRAYARC